MPQEKNILLGIIKLINISFIFLIILNFNISKSNNQLIGNFVEIKILDKVNSQNYSLKLQINNEKRFKDLIIKALK